MNTIIYKKTEEINQTNQPASVALGYFDSVHTAHRQVIERIFDNKDLTPAVFTFVLDADTKNKTRDQNIIPVNQRIELLEQLGVKVIFMPDFSEIKNLSAQQFVNDILFDKLNAKSLSCGYNFRFGHDQTGDVQLLRQMCDERGVQLNVFGEYSVDDVKVSSTAVKQFLSVGEVEKANKLLGYRYFIKAPVVTGKQLGRTIGFPTMNQNFLPECFVPKFGVYHTVTEIDGKHYQSITNVGIKPTISGFRAPLAETFVINYNGDTYSKTIKVEFVSFLRSETRFSGIEELKQAIENDVRTVCEKQI